MCRGVRSAPDSLTLKTIINDMFMKGVYLIPVFGVQSYLSRLPWIFPWTPLEFNGAPGNIQDNLTIVLYVTLT